MTKGLVIIPFIDCVNETTDALQDASYQLGGQVDVLLIDQGSADPTVGTGLVAADCRIRVWRHAPPMPSLAATWNAALDYAWELGHEDAMVWNNDIRVRPGMYADLRLLAAARELWFVSPVNCRDSAPPVDWTGPIDQGWQWVPEHLGDVTLGGPDFSCFLITRACHNQYRFDERFQPAYHEDGDYHRRLWLGGDGAKIAGANLPYLHYGSRTIHRSNEAAHAFSRQFEACRARYVQKWGGEPHQETRIIPDVGTQYDNVGTPGGYLDGAYPSGSADTECISCKSKGFEKRTGQRAPGRTLTDRPDLNNYVGCSFCSGHLNGEADGGALG